MFPQFSAYYSNKQQLIGCITTVENDNGKFDFIVIDSNTEKIIFDTSYEAKDIKSFVDGFPSPANYKNKVFKAFIVNLFDLHLGSTPHKNTPIDVFCLNLKDKINDLEIPSYLISSKNFKYSTLLISTRIEVNIGEDIAILLPLKTGFTVGEFKFTSNGYQIIQQRNVTVDFKAKPNIIKQKLFDDTSLKPQKIILWSSACPKRFPHEKVFKSMNYSTYNCCLTCRRAKVFGEICKWLIDKSYSKFHILPFSNTDIRIYGQYGTEKNIIDLANIKFDDLLPITKTATFKRSVPEYHIVIKFVHGLAKFEEEIPKDCHRYKITVTVDEDNLHVTEFEELEIDNLDDILAKFDETLEESKIPVIGFFDNSSVIAVHKINNGYEFLKEWNGEFGNDIFISFNQKKPQFGKAAVDALKTKNTFVVYDLLKIMSMPPNEIKAAKHWGFTITKSSENPVLLEFNHFKGTRRSAPPAFLMAMSLRQHLKAIKNECGEKPKKIEIFVLENEFSEEEMERIHEGLKSACELLKVECNFIETERSEFI